MLRIRLMTNDDYEQAYALWTGTAGMGMRSLDDSKQGIAKFLSRNPATNFVAVDGERLAGILLCGHDGRRAYIYHTAVAGDYRRKGAGRALVEACLQALRAEKINKVALVAFKSNDSGNAFWKSLGFEERTDLCYRNLSLNSDNQ